MEIQVGRGDGTGIPGPKPEDPVIPAPVGMTTEEFKTASVELGSLLGWGLRVTVPENRSVDQTRHRQQEMSQDIQRFPTIMTLMNKMNLTDSLKQIEGNKGFFLWGVIGDQLYSEDVGQWIKDDKKTITQLNWSLEAPKEHVLLDMMQTHAYEDDRDKARKKSDKLIRMIIGDSKNDPRGFWTRRQPGKVGTATSVTVGWWGWQDWIETNKRLKEFNPNAL